jgi:hypothetical protein
MPVQVVLIFYFKKQFFAAYGIRKLLMLKNKQKVITGISPDRF